MINITWPNGPVRPQLKNNEVHIWCASTTQPAIVFDRLFGFLSPTEKESAARFVFDKDRICSIVARGTLRYLLGAYLGAPPESFVFTKVGNGKPALPPESGASGATGNNPIHFNISHSGAGILLGFTLIRDIGVDIERVRPMPDAVDIAESYFSKSEKEALRSLPDDQKTVGFFNGWSRKEAFIKTYGEGLSRELDSFDVELAPGNKSRLLAVGGDAEQAKEWTLEDLSPAEEYAAAFCMEAKTDSVQCFQWEGSGLSAS